MNFKHIILMRFNLRMPGYEKSSDPDWLERRMDLFEKRMLPSLEGQTCRNFKVCPLLDADFVPKSLDYRISKWYSDICYPIYLNSGWAVDDCMYDNPALKNLCQNTVEFFLQGNEDYLITTRMDSDDAVHRDFVKILQEEARPDTLEFLNYPLGWALKDGMVYQDGGNRNMFITLVEPLVKDKPVNTVHCVWHKKAMEFAPIRQIGMDKRYWLRGIHDENRSSKLRGHNKEFAPIELSNLKPWFTLGEYE